LKKEAKTFAWLSRTTPRQPGKSFLVRFSKKHCFLPNPKAHKKTPHTQACAKRWRKGAIEVDKIAAAPARTRVLTRTELPADTVQLARFLIGKMLVRQLNDGVAGGRIVETEAYTIGDAAAHAYRGITPRNRALFLEHGHAYVYIAYGVSFMLNVASETAGVGAGVLIRAIEPTEGIAIMARNRGTDRLRDLARGPGRLCAALDIDRRLDGIDLCQAGPLWLGSDEGVCGEIALSTRIGITRAADSLLRFFVRGNRFVSGTARLNR
jgi:DNA-3-methyladenine glycosylase